MAFHPKTPILTKDGYRLICEINIGDILLTPLGNAVVENCLYFKHTYNVPVYFKKFTMYGYNRFLCKDLTWKYFYNQPYCDLLTRCGLYKGESSPPLVESSEIFSFNDLIEHHVETFIPIQRTPGWILSSSNKIMVVDNMVSEARFFVDENAKIKEKELLPNLPPFKVNRDTIKYVSDKFLSKITADQLESFRNEYF